jgi:hypothetical protein
MVLEYARQHLPLSLKSPSFVGFFIYQHHFVRINGIHHAAPGEVLYNDNALAARPFYSFYHDWNGFYRPHIKKCFFFLGDGL